MVKRVVVERFGGPEVLKVVEEDAPQPGPGQVRVRVLAAGVSFTDALIRAGTYLGGPKPPFTPGYELVGVVEKLGPGCSRLREGDRIGALTVWGADAESVCVAEKYAVRVPEDLDPAEVVSLIFPYMTAYQMLHRTARVNSGETVLVHGAAGRWVPPPLSWGRRPVSASSGPLPVGIAPRSRGWARFSSTTGTRISWRGRAS
jgi:NADPH2:quinone reductase